MAELVDALVSNTSCSNTVRVRFPPLALFLFLFVRFLILLLIPIFSFGQTIPESRTVDWSIAGFEGSIPEPSTIIDVTAFGATGDGVTNDGPAIRSAISSATIDAVIHFPPGEYLIDSTLYLPSGIVLRGSGPDSSKILFDHTMSSGHGIQASGGILSSTRLVLDGYKKNSRELIVNDTSGLKVGDFIELMQDNGAWDTKPISWAEDAVGQIFKLVEVKQDTLVLDAALHMDMDTALNLRFREIAPVINVGVECLSMERINNDSVCVCNNINFSYAYNCWVRGIESSKSIGAHVLISASSHVEISGSYFHHAFEYNGVGTRGYGVTLNHHSCYCLVENNVFEHLRHSMMVKEGANGNVFGYNYSFDPFRSEVPFDAGADISCHGHYPFANLFEGNIAQFIFIDLYWGPSGPYNTFFRNQLNGYGVVMSTDTVQTNDQNFVGNEITSTLPVRGNLDINGTGHFLYSNNHKGTIKPSGTDSLADSSYYLDSKPYFWDFPGSWPSIGYPNEHKSGNIPARRRYEYGEPLTICSPDDVIYNHVRETKDPTTDVRLFPNPVDKVLRVEGGFSVGVEYCIYNVIGVKVAEGKVAEEGRFRFNVSTLDPGIYFIRLTDVKKEWIMEFLVL